MDKRRFLFQLTLALGIASLIISSIIYFKHQTTLPIPGTVEDSVFQTIHGPVAVPDTTLSDTTFLQQPDTLLLDTTFAY